MSYQLLDQLNQSRGTSVEHRLQILPGPGHRQIQMLPLHVQALAHLCARHTEFHDTLARDMPVIWQVTPRCNLLVMSLEHFSNRRLEFGSPSKFPRCSFLTLSLEHFSYMSQACQAVLPCLSAQLAHVDM